MTQRRRLDAFLLDAARERGVEVREGTTIDRGAGRTSDVVVGADGANGTTARSFGLGEGIVHGVAYEGNVAYGVVSRERYARRAVVELADIPGGYGWVFAKGDHVNVGVGAWQTEGPRLARSPGARLRRSRPRARPARPISAVTACRSVAAERRSRRNARCSSAMPPG